MSASAPLVMGILNVTPDSFHDGGRFADPDAALYQVERLVAEGVDWIDIGGESTRPGAPAVSATVEAARVVPVVRAVHDAYPELCISVDTAKAQVAYEALRAGARAVNDVTALGDPELAAVVAQAGCTLMLMHMRGTPRTMQDRPAYDDVVAEVRAFLLERVDRALRAGVAREQLWIDPGLGFGKTVEHNLALVRGLPALVSTGFPVLVGASRKSFIGHVLDQPRTEDRLVGSLAVAALAVWLGASMLRVHDVGPTRRAVDMAWALRGERT